ncbi:hypothetical protein AHAS_Ahas20G0038500 [Arachis hypogaea]
MFFFFVILFFSLSSSLIPPLPLPPLPPSFFHWNFFSSFYCFKFNQVAEVWFNSEEKNIAL